MLLWRLKIIYKLFTILIYLNICFGIESKKLILTLKILLLRKRCLLVTFALQIDFDHGLSRELDQEAGDITLD
jgi:hypothetical protein